MVDVTIVYQADPLGKIAGGIDSFIRGILRWAPEDIDFSLIGVTTDPELRPVGKWTYCSVGGKEYRFFPVLNYSNPSKRGMVPLVVRFIAGILRYQPHHLGDIIEFHRIEPSVIFYYDPRPKTIVFHSSVFDLYYRNSDILWCRFPRLYLLIQDILIGRFSTIYSVREDVVTWYRERYHKIGDRFRFTPTWYEPEVFSALDSVKRCEIRKSIDVLQDDRMIVTVGRLDKSKDPILLLDAALELFKKSSNIKLVYVGDGVLRSVIENKIRSYGLNERVVITGILSPDKVAEIVGSADVFALSSAYENMPICILESLACGVPVVSMDVGEVKRVVKNGLNGVVVKERNSKSFADAIEEVLEYSRKYSGRPCIDSVADYQPQRVLAPIYENYRRLYGGLNR